MRLISSPLAVLLSAALAVPAAAAAAPTAPVPASAFAATVAGRGHYELRAALSGGGSFTVKSDPVWTVQYPRLILPEVSLPAGLHTAPQANWSASTPNAGDFTLGGVLPGIGAAALTQTSCAGKLGGLGPSAGPAEPAVVDVAGARIQLTLPTMALIGPATSSCTPSQADAAVAWRGTLRSWATGLMTTTPHELLGGNVIARPADVTTIAGATGRLIGPCVVAGSCEQDLRWTGAVTLVKRCRNLAGTAARGGAGPFSCASVCNGASCSLEQARVLPAKAVLHPRSGRVRAGVACYGDSVCAGTAVVRAGRTVLGRSAFRLTPTASGIVAVRLNAAGVSRLAHARRVRARLTLRLGAGSVRGPAAATVTLRR